MKTINDRLALMEKNVARRQPDPQPSEDDLLLEQNPDAWLTRWLTKAIECIEADRFMMAWHYKYIGGQETRENSNFVLSVISEQDPGFEDMQDIVDRLNFIYREITVDGWPYPRDLQEMRGQIVSILASLKQIA